MTCSIQTKLLSNSENNFVHKISKLFNKTSNYLHVVTKRKLLSAFEMKKLWYGKKTQL
jgi:hypothetical protein